MKKIFKYMAAALLAVNFTSCSDFLDKEVDLTLDAEQVFQKFENTRGYLANIYTYLPDAFGTYCTSQGNECKANSHNNRKSRTYFPKWK